MMLYQREVSDAVVAPPTDEAARTAALDALFANFDLADYLRTTSVGRIHHVPDAVDRAAAEAATRVAQAEVAEAESDIDLQPPPIDPGRMAQAREAFRYACVLVRGAIAHLDAIDTHIRAHAENWRLERMPIIDRNILRLAIYEMLYESSVPKVVIVDEAIELAKVFGTEHSGRFVNGLLDGVLQSTSRRPAHAAAAGDDPAGDGGGS